MRYIILSILMAGMASAAPIPLRDARLTTNADGGGFAITNLTDVVLTNGTRLSTAGGGGDLSALSNGVVAVGLVASNAVPASGYTLNSPILYEWTNVSSATEISIGEGAVNALTFNAPGSAQAQFTGGFSGNAAGLTNVVDVTNRVRAVAGSGVDLTYSNGVVWAANAFATYWQTQLTARVTSVQIPVPSNEAASAVEIEATTWNTNNTAYYSAYFRVNGRDGTNTWYSHVGQQFGSGGYSPLGNAHDMSGGYVGTWRGPRDVTNGGNHCTFILRDIHGVSPAKSYTARNTMQHGHGGNELLTQNTAGNVAFAGSVTGITLFVTDPGGLMDTGSVIRARLIP